RGMALHPGEGQRRWRPCSLLARTHPRCPSPRLRGEGARRADEGQRILFILMKMLAVLALALLPVVSLADVILEDPPKAKPKPRPRPKPVVTETVTTSAPTTTVATTTTAAPATTTAAPMTTTSAPAPAPAPVQAAAVPERSTK